MLNYSANGPSGYNLTNSLRFRSSASASLTRTFATPTSGTTWTMSFWFKRGALGVGQQIFSKGNTSTQPWTFFYIDANGALNLYEYSTSGTSPNFNLATNAVFRDPSSWYHIVVTVDTTQATAANRQKVYVNGVQQTFSSASYYPQNTVTQWNSSGGTSYIGRQGGGDYLDGYMTEVNFVDGQQLTPSSFGSTNATTGVWQPAKYSGSYGTNGFYLNFSNIALTSGSNTGLGKDSSGNGNYWNTNNISVTAGTTYDAMTDVPTLTSATVANYCVKNPLVASTGATITGANLNSTGSTTTFANARGTFTLTSGKWYWEETITGSSIYDVGVGLVLESSVKSASNTRQTGWYNICNAAAGQISSTTNGGAFVNISTTDFATNDVIMVAYDADTGYIWFGKNGTWYPPTTGGSAGNPAAGTNQTITAVSSLIPSSFHYNTNAGTASNFGQRPFTYTPPTGYLALNTFNLPNPTILQGNKYMDATLYTGTGSAGTDVQTVVNAGQFKPDLVWTKSRSGAYSHHIGDSVRGIDKTLFSNTTGAEATYTYDIHAFNSNGFTVGNDGSQNTSGQTYVGWQWQAGQGTTSSNTSGSITSTVSVNASAGFSVVTYTGTGVAGNKTIGHGLGVAPSMIILKDRDTASSGGPGALGANDWFVWHSSFANVNSILGLNSTVATQTTSGFWGASVPSSTVFGINGTLASLNESGDRYLAYCWAAISGFSAFGSYTGNGSTDGPFVYCGFRPKYVMIKISSGIENWYVYDSVRNTYNLTNTVLSPNDSGAEYTASASVLDLLSNGFKIRGAAGGLNVSSATYIFAAWAENPFRNSLAR